LLVEGIQPCTGNSFQLNGGHVGIWVNGASDVRFF
jgi:hypothetical protein